jgi:uncharacterized protein (TIGR02145 family)
MKKLSWIVLLLTISTFSQTPGGGVTDIDGNRYNSVIIGTQEWMKENLNVSKYSDGTIIPQVTDPATWANLTTGAWCYYNNDPANGAIYGKLYNWYAVAGIFNSASFNDPSLRKQIAPTGWHVPSDAERTTLTTFLGATEGGKMKSIGTSLWLTPNTGATNSSGFTGLPGGYRTGCSSSWCSFDFIGSRGYWWQSTQHYDVLSWEFDLRNDNDGAYRSSAYWINGFSVRLLNNTLLNNQSFNSNSFNIFPNPAKDQITIDLGTNSNVNGGNYKILNMLGQEVQNGALNSQQNIIQLNNIKEQGIYFVKIYDSSNSLLDTKKIIIQQ